LCGRVHAGEQRCGETEDLRESQEAAQGWSA
jgi:hypothetical protein